VQTGVLAVVGYAHLPRAVAQVSGAGLAFQLAFFLALTALLYHYGHCSLRNRADSTPPMNASSWPVAKIIWWINAAWVLTGFTRVFLIFERRRARAGWCQDLVVWPHSIFSARPGR